MLRSQLTPLEYEMVGLLAFGYTFAQIGFVVGLKPGYVKKRFYEMYDKTGTSDGLELAVWFAWERRARYHVGDGPVPASFPKRVTVNGLCVFESRRGHHDIEATL